MSEQTEALALKVDAQLEGRVRRVTALASDWGSEVVDVGHVGHLNPASGYGPWAKAEPLIARLGAAL